MPVDRSNKLPKVLLVEDEPELADEIQVELRRLGYDVLSVKTREEGLSAAQTDEAVDTRGQHVCPLFVTYHVATGSSAGLAGTSAIHNGADRAIQLRNGDHHRRFDRHQTSVAGLPLRQ